MKKVFMLLALLAVAGIANANLLTNGGFETGDLTGWATSPADPVNQTTTIVGGTAPEGFYYASMISDSSSWANFLTQYIDITPGATTLDLSFDWSNTVNPGGKLTAVFSVNFYDGDVAYIGYDNTTLLSDATTGNDWTSYSDALTLPAGTEVALVKFYMYHQGTFNVDNQVATVPEPATLLLLGLGGLVLSRRKRA
jgi:hypothetical protein